MYHLAIILVFTSLLFLIHVLVSYLLYLVQLRLVPRGLTAAIMDGSKGRMMSVQADLPTLPVPSLQQTLDKYLKTVRPIVTPEAYKQTEQVI